MKKIKAKIVADSINPQGDRITTYLLTFPRFILAELNTHRIFSKNSASSRAIPFEKMVKMVQEDPFIPIAWQRDHKGMQGNKYITDEHNLKICIEDWLEARNNAIKSASDLSKGFNKKDKDGNWIATKPEDFVDRVTKQLCNRLLEPFVWHTVLLTGTEFKNFFELRCPQYSIGADKQIKSKKDAYQLYSNICETFTKFDWYEVNHSQAEIHMQALAEAMWDAMNESIPKTLQSGDWHIPFGDKIQLTYTDYDSDGVINQEGIYKKIRIATARCARLSYMTFDGIIDYEKDIKLHDSLLESHHMSPFEHCARAMSENEYTASKLTGYSRKDKDNYGWCNNFKGFIQYRHSLENKI